MSRHGGWQAQPSSSGARATSLEAAVAPIHHRRESACSLDVGLVHVPAALQRVVGLTSRLDCTLAPSTAEGTVPAGRAADGRSRRHWYRTAKLRRIDAFSQFTATYAWTTPQSGFLLCADSRLRVFFLVGPCIDPSYPDTTERHTDRFGIPWYSHCHSHLLDRTDRRTHSRFGSRKCQVTHDGDPVTRTGTRPRRCAASDRQSTATGVGGPCLAGFLRSFVRVALVDSCGPS